MRVEDSSVEGLGSRVQGSGFVKFRVQDLGFRDAKDRGLALCRRAVKKNHVFFWLRIQGVSMARILAMEVTISGFRNGSAEPLRRRKKLLDNYL